MKKEIVLTAFLLLLTLPIASKTHSEGNMQDIVVKIENYNWEGGKSKVEITGNDYQYSSSTKIGWTRCSPDRSRRGTITSEGISTIIKTIQKSRFFSLNQEDYPPPGGKHGTSIVEIEFQGKSNRIAFYKDGYPAQLTKRLGSTISENLIIDKSLQPLKVAYIGRNDPDRTESFKDILVRAGYETTVYAPKDVVTESLIYEEYDVLIIDGGSEVWSKNSTLKNISGKAVVGIGSEGHFFFNAIGEKELGSVRSEILVQNEYTIRGKGLPFQKPYSVEPSNENSVKVTKQRVQSVNIPSKRRAETLLFSENIDNYSPLTGQTFYGRFNMLWGWDVSPEEMTEDGVKLFLNILRYAPCVY